MELKTRKSHPVFDAKYANRIYGEIRSELSGEIITSPFDLSAVEFLRDLCSMRSGKSVPTDLFVLGKGSPEDRKITRISGIPYWPKGRPWPVGKDGRPLQFFAQFCFLDSLDITGDLPGEILVIFVPHINEEPRLWIEKSFHFEWVNRTRAPLIDRLPSGVKRFSRGEWYGVIHRTCDYPDVESRKPTPAEREIRSTYLLPIAMATKIGGLPNWIQQPLTWERDRESSLAVVSFRRKGTIPAKFLCQVASVQAEPLVPFPWTNRPKPVGLWAKRNHISSPTNALIFHDMGSIYIFMRPTGECFGVFESY